MRVPRKLKKKLKKSGVILRISISEAPDGWNSVKFMELWNSYNSGVRTNIKFKDSE